MCSWKIGKTTTAEMILAAASSCSGVWRHQIINSAGLNICFAPMVISLLRCVVIAFIECSRGPVALRLEAPVQPEVLLGVAADGAFERGAEGLGDPAQGVVAPGPLLGLDDALDADAIQTLLLQAIKNDKFLKER